MSNKDTDLSFTWDRSLDGEIAAAVAAQEARGLLPPGTSWLVSGGILFISKMGVAAIVTHGHALGRLKIGETFVHVAKTEEVVVEPDDASVGSQVERTPEESDAFLKAATAAIFVKNPNTLHAPAPRRGIVRLAHTLASLLSGQSWRAQVDAPAKSRP